MDTSRYSLGGSARRGPGWRRGWAPTARRPLAGDDLPRPGAVIMQYTGLRESTVLTIRPPSSAWGLGRHRTLAGDARDRHGLRGLCGQAYEQSRKWWTPWRRAGSTASTSTRPTRSSAPIWAGPCGDGGRISSSGPPVHHLEGRTVQAHQESGRGREGVCGSAPAAGDGPCGDRHDPLCGLPWPTGEAVRDKGVLDYARS